MDIDFIMSDPQYKLAGLTFRRVRGGGAANGSSNLPKEKIKIEEDAQSGATTIHFKDKYADHGKKNSWSWEIYILVQDYTGAIGVIDPDVENQD